MTAPDTSAELLTALGRGRFGGIDVVRITPAGSATRRESMFDPTVVARLWSGVGSLASWPRPSRRPTASTATD